jgi:hypothetical protein
MIISRRNAWPALVSHRVYRTLRRQAADVLAAGYPAIQRLLMPYR